MSTKLGEVQVHHAEREAGLEKTGRSHVLRHTFVTELGEEDVPAHVIQELVGHKDLKTTSRYLHVRERQAHAAIQKLEQRNAAGRRNTERDPQEHIRST